MSGILKFQESGERASWLVVMSKWDADDVDPKARVARRAPIDPIGASEVFAMFQEGAPKALMVRATPPHPHSPARLLRSWRRLFPDCVRRAEARVSSAVQSPHLSAAETTTYRGALWKAGMRGAGRDQLGWLSWESHGDATETSPGENVSRKSCVSRQPNSAPKA